MTFKKTLAFGAGMMLGAITLAQAPISAPGASTDWTLGGNTGISTTPNVIGATWAQGAMWFTTGGATQYRMSIQGGGTGIGDGRIGFGENLPTTFVPADRLQSHTVAAGDNCFRFSNATAANGFRVGLTGNSTALFEQFEQDIFRFDMADGVGSSQLTKVTIDNESPSSCFTPSYLLQDVARVGIWRGAGPSTGGALAMLHLGDPSLVNYASHRDWMNIGTFCQSNSDGMYVGLREIGPNETESIISWGDDSYEAGSYGDRMLFLFNTHPGYGQPASACGGLEVARWISDAVDGRVLLNSDPLQVGLDPQNTLHVIGQSPNGNAAIPAGNSGLRFEFLNAAVTPPVPNPGPGVLAVDAQGNVIYVNTRSVISPPTDAIDAQNERIEKLEAQIEELKTLLNAATQTGAMGEAKSTTLGDPSTVVLNQNAPNPFHEHTVISYVVPEDRGSAQIQFFTSDGLVMKTVDIAAKGQGSITVYAEDLSTGVYYYRLVVDGEIIDTKKMEKQ